MEKAAALTDSRLFLPASTRDACVQEQAVLLLPTTQQQPTNQKQTTTRQQLLTSTIYCNFNYLLQLQPPTATSTTYCNFNYLLQLQLPTATTHIYCNYYNPLVLLSSSSELQLLNIRVEAQRQIRCNEVTSRLFRCHRVVPRLRSNFTKVSQ
jgi:hypothetical protein